MRELWVDPEGVGKTGDTYANGSEILNGYLRNLQDLRSRYAASWGNDDMGQQFAAKFVEGLDALEDIVTGVGRTMDFTGEGLNGAGKAYRQADDEAFEAGSKLRKGITEIPIGSPDLPADAYAPRERLALSEDQPGLVRGQRVEGRKLLPMESRERVEGKLLRGEVRERPSEVEALQPMRRLPARTERHVADEPGEPTRERGAMKSVRPASSGTGLMTSSFQMKATWGGATVDGSPIPAGYHLIAGNQLSDGTVTMDADGYTSIVPLGLSHQAIDARGNPIVPDANQQMFLVQENPSFRGITPGQTPHYVKFSPDGSAVPYVPELETPAQ